MKYAVLAIAIATGTLFTPMMEAQAQTSGRYTPPAPAQLSPDLASPWILQLARKPGANGQRSLKIAPPRINYLPQPRFQMRRTTNVLTPLQADPVRSKRKPVDMRIARTAPRSAPVKPSQEFDPRFAPQIVTYDSSHPAGTVIIDTESRFLYLVEGNGTARRYGVGVGKPGFEWAGTHKVTRKAEWPSWRPPAQMIAREKKKGRILPSYMEGGPSNPLGARALYLGSTLYRVHGTNQPWSIGKAVSSGCIRMRNEDVIDLYERVGVGTKVVVS